MKSHFALENLLLSLFGNNVSELGRFIKELAPSGSRIYVEVSLNLSMAQYTHDVVQQLAKHGMINIDLIGALCAIRPSRKTDIEKVWDALLREPTVTVHAQSRPPGASTTPADSKKTRPTPKSEAPPPPSTKAPGRTPAASSSSPGTSAILPIAGMVALAASAIALDSYAKSQERKRLYSIVLDDADTARIEKALRERGVPLDEALDPIDVVTNRLPLGADLLEACMTLTQLRAVCVTNNFSTSGNKREVAQRIADAIESMVSN